MPLNVKKRFADRQSNAELVRLVAMFLIVLHHNAVHALYGV